VTVGRATRTPTPVRALLVEDHVLVRAAIADTLTDIGIAVTGQASSGEEALEMLLTSRPDIVLVDLDLPGMSGLALTREIVGRLEDATLIVLSGSNDEDDVLAAIRAGAAGYLTKDLSPEAFARAVLGAAQGELPMPRRMAARVIRALVAGERRRANVYPSDASALSQREEEVLVLVCEGLTDRAIGERLGISARTVGHHVGSILAKLGVTSRAAAARVWTARAGPQA
jgi:DNA-binding NarL/FixJ family response regulator